MGFAQRAEQLLIVQVIRTGLVSMIPVLLIGAFALVFKSFPVQGYQDFLVNWGDGFLLDFFDLINKATFGVLAVYMTFFVSRSYMEIKADPSAPMGGAVASSLISFFILAGVNAEGFSLDYLGPKSMFLAILTGLCSSAMYLALFHVMNKSGYVILTHGADRHFNRMMAALGPIVVVAIVFALFDAAIIHLFDVGSFREMVILALNKLFIGSGSNFSSGFFFVLFSTVLWFFGIHGSDTLEGVMQAYFMPGLEANQAAVSVGAEPTHILTKQFFDCFVLLGGCGATMCLLITILMFSRIRSRRRLGAAAALPMLFNINEIMVFGLPIIYNPIMLIPFLVTPLVCYSTAFFAISSGMVPMITGNVEWTTPILIGGYHATGSIAGSILQLINLALGVLIYMPFVRILDRQTEDEYHRVFDDFMKYYRDHEETLAAERIIDRQDVYGDFARNLTADLRYKMNDHLQIHYQPQYNYEGKCVGVESLLRWNHPAFGMLYPPLVIKLAEDGGFLLDLEEAIVKRVLCETERIKKQFADEVKISFNVTGTTVVSDRFLQFCQNLNVNHPFAGSNICIEVTEQATLAFDDTTLKALRQLKEMGIQLAIDDFSMGHTSIEYMKNSLFDFIKLDGSLVRGMGTHENSRQIISSIVRLANSLHMTVIAEYVETEAQREELHEMGCDCYQGWLYSPAVPLD